MGSGQSGLTELQNTPTAKGAPNILKQSCSPAYCTTNPSLSEGVFGRNKENNSPEENTDWFHKNNAFEIEHVPILNQDQESVMNITQSNNSPVQLPGSMVEGAQLI
ncbi:uncharacterized protein LOC133910125 [Phragmites australis]|uniref:uncharacterized protein LOC133910125 n=1 Tax=Phragmites australis TaxID=29695 RepID=UPI002D778316|nr:uncharacterized protein LOC133910125 [Phragmites australis]